jgi:hypothetical protein
LEKIGARIEEVCRFAGAHDAGAGTPLGIAAAVADNLNVSFRVRRFWIFLLAAKEKWFWVTADAGKKTSTAQGQSGGAPWRQFRRALSGPRARGKRCVSLTLHGTAPPARAWFW